MKHRSSITLLALACCALAPAAATAQWRPLGLAGREVNRLREHGGSLYACTSTGLFRLSSDSPDTIWNQAGFAGQEVFGLAGLGPQTLLAARRLTGPTDTVSLFRSVDSGASWQPFQNGFGAGGSRQAFRLLAPAATPGTAFAGNSRIEKTTDGGLTWRVVAQAQVLNALEAAPANPQVLWAGGETVIFQPHVIKSVDGGETWKPFALFAGGDNAVDAIAGHPTDAEIVYLGMEGRVMKSENGGTTWSTVTSPDPSMYTFGLAIRPFLPLKLYAAGASFTPDPRGVVFHQSLDGGFTWQAIAYPAAAGFGANHLLLHTGAIEETVYVATGNGVYRHTQGTVDVPASAHAPRITLRGHPNPFARIAVIELSLPRTGRVAMRVVDPSGRTVAVLLDTVLEAGLHRIRWDARGVRSGVYFCRLEAGAEKRSLKLLRLE